LASSARAAAASAERWLFAHRRGEHWVGELESNVTITAEYVLLLQALGLFEILERRREAIVRYLSSRQKGDGSFGIAATLPGDVSTTVETYLALRILGLPEDDERLKAAERFIREAGGIGRVRVFTRINLALFGLFPWEAVPVVPPEFTLLPSWFFVNPYRLASWARSTMVPLFVLFHHKPLYALPNGRAERNGWLDHLWVGTPHTPVPYRESIVDSLRKHGPGWRSFFVASDLLLRSHERLRRLPPLAAVRANAVKECMRWILERQEPSGDWAGIFPPMLNGVLALVAEGYALDSDPVRRGLEAIERFSIDDAEGFRIEACQSPVWDTILSLIGLLDAGADPADPRLVAARRWVEGMQLTNEWGDWKVYNPEGPPGGFSFEYSNSWYPDVDDTAAVVIGFLKQNPVSATDERVRKAVAWMRSMQNKDGGWGAFDVDNDRAYLNEIPFSDMDSLCDPSSPDVAGRVLEALGILGDPSLGAVCARGIAYLRAAQEPEGSFYGRWGVNYVYGTSNVLNALARQAIPETDPMVARALGWLESVQNEDGGFGEGLESYADRSAMGRGPSTASQTAWGVMGLLAYRGADDPAVRRGIAWLVERQLAAGSEAGAWEEAEFTGTGFPRHFYLRYHMYRHYFPLMALGRFCRAAGA
jgi:squalene-hopene/tetraprenyl-beta-curcumene cyclase